MAEDGREDITKKLTVIYQDDDIKSIPLQTRTSSRTYCYRSYASTRG